MQGARTSILAALLCGLVAGAAHAQSSGAIATVAAPATLPGTPTGVSVVPPPPAGFDPLTATAEERAFYSIPPAPDPKVAPDAYEHWRSAVTGPKRRALVSTRAFLGR